ncbi:MAG TPA: L,D-transpeptidase family protein [Rhizomicrobium sp.]|jgi:lipoprotein-anchoring transpeptidase ErfK/SrfK|nr:L,D-transpeptidase family protein [Rhizomicrobium sp.]
MMYLLAALAFSTLLLFDRAPAIEQQSRQAVASGLDTTRAYVVTPIQEMAQSGTKFLVALLPDISGPRTPVRTETAAVRTETAAVTPRLPRVVIPPAPEVIPAHPTLAAPQIPDVTPPDIQIAQAPTVPAPVVAPPKPMLTLIPPAAPPVSAHASISPAELVRVSERLKDNLTKEMLDNFALFLYVSKADNGPWAQHMYVFRKDAGGNLNMLYAWPASTGREKIEIAANGTRQPSYTPQGYYQLDPDRMYKTHFSGQWHEPMPHAMFFNWENHGLQTGLAIHGAVGLEVADLGTRASAGCIRVAPENARLLFDLIRAQYKGLAPRFAYDRRTATMSNAGVMMHDAAGNLQLADGYKVLVFVENYGGDNVVAALF